jgi:hypothetical protein
MNTMRIDEEDQNNEDERTFGVVTPSGYVVVTLGHDGLLRCVELLGKVTEGEMEGAKGLVQLRLEMEERSGNKKQDSGTH